MENSNSILTLNYTVSPEDFSRAGEASSDIKKKLKQMGVPPQAIRKVAIAMYEGEINMVIHAKGGEITVDITPEKIVMALKDVGPGIPDTDKVLQPGYSTASPAARALGFGAGMGLPNMKNNSDQLDIQSVVDVGTTVTMVVYI